jgi:dolichyl-phosphate beta-glucosyltransferase
MTRQGTSVVVVPCYNEARRLDGAAFLALAGTAELEVLFVDDGSTDGTVAVLDGLAATCDGIRVLHLPVNQGKAEAVRVGLLAALAEGAETVGYLDADLSTPPSEYLRLLAVLDGDPALQMVLGSRVALLGSHIERRARRHYLGRVFGTLASASLRLPVYDTQCGAKAFRASAALGAALEVPFISRWVFDVELIGRLRRGARVTAGLPVTAFREVPLEHWSDVPGGTLGPLEMGRAVTDLARISWGARADHVPEDER